MEHDICGRLMALMLSMFTRGVGCLFLVVSVHQLLACLLCDHLCWLSPADKSSAFADFDQLVGFAFLQLSVRLQVWVSAFFYFLVAL